MTNFTSTAETAALFSYRRESFTIELHNQNGKMSHNSNGTRHTRQDPLKDGDKQMIASWYLHSNV
jgi:hypothetical protein